MPHVHSMHTPKIAQFLLNMLLLACTTRWQAEPTYLLVLRDGKLNPTSSHARYDRLMDGTGRRRRGTAWFLLAGSHRITPGRAAVPMITIWGGVPCEMREGYLFVARKESRSHGYVLRSRTPVPCNCLVQVALTL